MEQLTGGDHTMRGRQTPLTPQFTFAGFTFPRYLGILPPSSRQARQDRYKCTGGYYTAPTPQNAGQSMFFYLDSDGSPNRWTYADEIDGARIDHTGWYTNEYGDIIRGIVVRLSHGRMLAGWTMGEGMASECDGTTIYTDAIEAARDADTMAEQTAEREREYQEQERERIDAEEAELEANQGGDDEELQGY